MVRAITKDDINEVRALGLNIELVAGFKGAAVINGVIDEAVQKGIPIVCIGGENTGKSTALKVILSTIPGSHEDVAVDGIKSEVEAELIRNSKIKYAVLHAYDAREAYNIITCNATKVSPNTMLVELRTNEDGHRTISGVYEIITFDNGKSNALIPIVDIHKERFRKINEIN